MDPATSALTGHLPFYLLMAAALTWPIAAALLRLYVGAVQRSMRSASPRVPATPFAPGEVVEGAAPGPPARLLDAATPRAAAATVLLNDWRGRPRRAALAYVAGGAAFASILAVAELLADRLAILPLRFAMLFWIAFWPAVLTVSLVAATRRRDKVWLVAGYLGVLTLIGAAGRATSPDLTWWQVYESWIIFEVPASLLFAVYLLRRVRAVGPLIFVFLFMSLLGTELLTLVGSSDLAMRAVVEAMGHIGLGGTAGFWTVWAVGFLLCAVLLGVPALLWVRRRYVAKAISDESLAVDAMWLLLAVYGSISLVFESPWWFLMAPVSFAAFKLVSSAVMKRVVRGGEAGKHPTLLLLRSFSIGKASERLFDAFRKYWGRIGSIQMITGADFATRTVDPQEFLDFTTGRLGRRFIDDAATLEQRLRERDLERDRDGRYRVNEFFCHDNTWRAVLSRLVETSDAVLMDLRGFTRENAGCVFEIRELARAIPLARVVFIVNERTDQALLAEALGARDAVVWHSSSTKEPDCTQLLGALAMAVTSSSAA